MTIDWWTLGLQSVNVVVLIWLLGHFFWRPVAAMIEQRRAAAQQMLTDATAARDKATAALAEIEHTREGFARERDMILADAHAAAERARAASVEEAAKQATVLQNTARASIEREKEAADKALTEQAAQLAVDIAQRLAARLDGPAIRNSFLEWLAREIRTLPAPVRQAVADNGATLNAISAAPLDAAEQQRCRAAISAAVGAQPRIDFTVDPALIAGLELHGPGLDIANSWRADLARIGTDLTHDERR